MRERVPVVEPKFNRDNFYYYDMKNDLNLKRENRNLY